MEINLQGAVPTPQALPGARSADFPVKAKTETNTGNPPATQVDSAKEVDLDSRRLEQVQRAAQSFFQDVYAVSDTRSTIYKDNSGQYITRYTSLRDGRVTYIPEPALLQYMESSRQPRQALVEIQA